jgi:hypothetical protein
MTKNITLEEAVRAKIPQILFDGALCINDGNEGYFYAKDKEDITLLEYEKNRKTEVTIIVE